MAKSKAEQDDFIMDSELGDGDLSDAQAAIAASNESAQRLIAGQPRTRVSCAERR